MKSSVRDLVSSGRNGSLSDGLGVPDAFDNACRRLEYEIRDEKQACPN